MYTNDPRDRSKFIQKGSWSSTMSKPAWISLRPIATMTRPSTAESSDSASASVKSCATRNCMIRIARALSGSSMSLYAYV
jgi:hypothetical protein